jgi:hypothetical protein
MWVKFTDTHWHRFTRQMKRRFLAGDVVNVPAKVGQAAIDAGRAVKMKKLTRHSSPEVDDGAETGRG